MKFKNNSDKLKFLKLDGAFVDVQPGAEIELDFPLHERDSDFELLVEEEKKEEPKVEEKKDVVDVSKLDEKSKARVEDLKEDLKDDGKANRSHKKKAKKSVKK